MIHVVITYALGDKIYPIGRQYIFSPKEYMVQSNVYGTVVYQFYFWTSNGYLHCGKNGNAHLATANGTAWRLRDVLRDNCAKIYLDLNFITSVRRMKKIRPPMTP